MQVAIRLLTDLFHVLLNYEAIIPRVIKCAQSYLNN